MSAPDCDVLIVGGGPAGSALACFLRQLGHAIVVLDAARFPRDKICGEGVSPEAWRLLAAMGAASAVRALRPHPLRGMQLTSPNGTTFRGEYEGRVEPGFAVRRLSLDAVLLDTARSHGADVREGTRATSLLVADGMVVGVASVQGDRRTEWRARTVVGADGRRSLVARRLGLLSAHPRLRRFAVRGYWDGVQGLDEVGEMHVAAGAYCGIAPLSAGTANITFVVDPHDLRGARGNLEGYYRQTLSARWPRIAERLQSARLCDPPQAIGPLALECRGVVSSGAVLLGDAAGFYDPFTGEGVTLALRTAELAAAAIDEALRAPAGSDRSSRALAGYQRARDAATRDKFRFNRRLQSVVASPGLANAVAARLARRPDLANRLVGIAGDFVPARSALGVRFAWDLLTA